MDEAQEYIECLFVHDVDSIPKLGKSGYQYDRLLLSAVLRRLVIDGSRLADLANRNYRLPLLVLVPEPESGNVPRAELLPIPEIVMKYAPDISERSCPPGFYHRPYQLADYLKTPVGVLFQPITARETIQVVANKLGGVHIGVEFRSEALVEINRRISFFGKGGVYHLFDEVAVAIWRCLAPLSEMIKEEHGGDCSFPIEGRA